MYIRPVSFNELRGWLLEKGYAEEQDGYGHVSADELATALLERFDIITESHKSVGD